MLNVFVRSGVRWFHTIDALCAIEFFMKYLLSVVLLPYSQVVSNALDKSSWLIYAPWRQPDGGRSAIIKDLICQCCQLNFVHKV